jgi:CxC6 like cysteine cluster associated with KDZ transposases
MCLINHSGGIHSTVTDGVTIGRPCCAVQDCLEPLPNINQLFCSKHNNLHSICAITTCTASVEIGFRTCTSPEHRKLEVYYHQQGKAMFQLKHRLEHAKISQTHDSLSTSQLPSSTQLTGIDDSELLPNFLPTGDNDMLGGFNTIDGDEDEGIGEGSGVRGNDDDTAIDENGICDGKPDSGNRSIRARFARRHTHNEELCVSSCGVILGRATFYGSEAPNGVRVHQ